MSPALPCLVLIVAAVQCALAQNTVRVMAEGERWRRADNGPLVRGALLPATEDLQGSAGASELILDCGPLGWRLYSCRGACKVPVCSGSQGGVTMQRVNPPGAGGLADSLTAWFKRELKTPVTLGVRSAGSPNDAVVLLDAKGGVHWAPALRRVLEGSYCLRLVLLPAGAPQTVAVQWNRELDAEGVAPAAGIRPGAYQVQKGIAAGGACRLDADGAAAWVVIAPEPNFRRLDAEWKQRLAWFDELEAGGVNATAVGIVRHALLAGYAESLGRP